VYLKDNVHHNNLQMIYEMKAAITAKSREIVEEECVREIDNFTPEVAEPIWSIFCKSHDFYAKRPRSLKLWTLIIHTEVYVHKNLEICWSSVGFIHFFSFLLFLVFTLGHL